MKTKTTHRGLWKRAFQVMLPTFLLSAMSVSAQISENFGTTTSTTIGAYTGYNNFGSLTFSGTGDIRTTTGSTGYTPSCAAAASGGSNVFLHTTKTFIIGNINTNSCGGTPISFSFGIYKSLTTENGSHMAVEYSTDGGSTWNPTSTISLPTGAGTAHWYLRSVSGIPVTCNLQIRFSNTASGSGPDFRIDDICMSCGIPAVTSCSASIDTTGTVELCEGGSITLTASSSGVGTTWMWNDGETTQSIVVSHSATFWVVVSNGCCAATSDSVQVFVHHDITTDPVVVASSSVSTICASALPVTVNLTARTNAADLFFSQYQEAAGFDKAIEIFNGTGHSVDLAQYHVNEYMNGSVAVSNSLGFSPGTIIADGATYVIANDSHSQIGGTLCYNQLWNQLLFNGNDAVELADDSAGRSADIFGDIGNNGSHTAWTAPGHYSTKDRTLYRKPCIFEGIAVNPNLPGVTGFPTLATEWIVDTLASDTGFCSHAFGATAYNWSAGTTPSSGASVTATPTVTTTYTVTGVYCDGCPYIDSVTVVVDPGCRLAAPQTNSVTPEVKADAYPNPFDGSVTLNVNTFETGLVKIEIVNMLGETVAVLNNNSLPAGTHIFTWNGYATDGGLLPNGVYSCKVTTDNSVKTVMLVKSVK